MFASNPRLGASKTWCIEEDQPNAKRQLQTNGRAFVRGGEWLIAHQLTAAAGTPADQEVSHEPKIRFLAQHLLHAGLSPLSDRDRRVIARVARRMHTARDPNEVFDERLTFGEKLADRVAVIGGSWSFIIGFMLFLVAWAVINTVVLISFAFDPYPFIFLNLLLSMLAALQAPVIMMSSEPAGRQGPPRRRARL